MTSSYHFLQGFEGFLSSKDAARKRLQGFKAEDRLFSLSSTSSQAVMLCCDLSLCVAGLSAYLEAQACRDVTWSWATPI